MWYLLDWCVVSFLLLQSIMFIAIVSISFFIYMHGHATRSHQELLEEGLSINPGAVKGLSMSSEAMASHGEVGQEQLRRIREKEDMLRTAALEDYKVIYIYISDHIYKSTSLDIL